MTHVSPVTFVSITRVAVGSGNPVKVAAVRAVLGRLSRTAAVESVEVASGVPDQPWGDEQTIRGATARARAAREASDADLGVGIEGGVVDVAGEVRTCAWAAVAARDGVVHVGGSLAMPLPPTVAALVRGGMELGHAMDAVTGSHDVKRGAGAVGILTAGLVDRRAAYEVIVTYALSPWIAPAWWSVEPGPR